MKKIFYFNLLLLTVLACQPEEDMQPESIDQRQEVLNVMDFTAQAVSEITVNSGVRKEVLGYAKREYDGEVTAHFTELLDVKNLSRSATSDVGAFARSFEHKAQAYQSELQQSRGQSVDDVSSDLEAYLKEHNMALYGPYLAENHANSNQPITVSFDPLDETKIANKGYKLVPKSSQGSAANHGSLDGPSSLDHYELVEVENVDDTYAYENPTLFVIIDDGNTNVPHATGQTGSSQNTTRDIDCLELEDTDIVQLSMRKFRLNGNLRSAPWLRNLLDMWVITADDISVNLNNTAVVNNNSAKFWREKQVSRENARKKNWLNPDISALDLNWKRDEVDAFIILANKTGDDGGEISANVRSIINSGGTNETTTTIDASVPMSTKFEAFHAVPYDRCGTMAVFKTDLGAGLHEGLAVFQAQKMDFTLELIVR